MNSVPAGARICPACGAPAEEEGGFCTSCGGSLDELLPDESGSIPVSYMRVEPLLFGVVPPLVTLAVACGLLLLGIVVLALGGWIGGLVLILLSVPLFVLYVGAAKRDPSNAVIRATSVVGDRLRSRLRFAGGSTKAWAETGRTLLRLRAELKALRIERDRVQFELGGAAYREETEKVKSLRTRLRELEEHIATLEHDVTETVERMRRRVARERLLVQPTRELRH